MIKYVAAAGLTALVLGIPGVNIYHHVTLPEANKYKIQSQLKFSLFKYPMLYHQIDIRLGTEIKQNEFYEDVESTLNNARRGDVIVFHLSGYGGDGQAMETMINDIHKSKAFVVMNVEGSTYSAHSYLAVSGDKLIMEPYTYMHFHYSTVLNTDCNTKTDQYDPDALDRGVSNREHCQVIKDANMTNANKLIFDIKLLTPEEKMSILTGHDVIITSNEFYKRTTVPEVK